ncbi:hypothetical protein FOA52_015526 [Chlamydomonas sp. UWO 241]|nr:hypothetical protein FOA52_015526 [Chlamydomonas sp. UWO 241]
MPVLPSHKIWSKPGGDDLGAILDASRMDFLQGHQQQKQAEQLQKQGRDDDDEVFIPEATVITQQLLRDATGEPDLCKAVALMLHDRRIEKIECMESVPGLRTLDLSFNNVSKVDGLASLSKLRELKLYDNKLVGGIGKGLQALTALHTLDLSSNRLSQLEGLRGLRGLRVLRVAHNALATLDGMGHMTGLEALDASNNAVTELGGLSSCVALKKLAISFNRISNLKGIQRCTVLEELHAADNQLTTLQGLKMATKTLDVLDVSSNRLTSIDTLADGCAALSELYVAGNQLCSLAGLASKAPELETLDAADNQLSDASALSAALSPLSSLQSARLEGNPRLGAGYAQALLAAVASLDSVDSVERPPKADVLTLDDSDAGRFAPTESEMAAFRSRMGIEAGSHLPPHLAGRPDTSSERHGETGDDGDAFAPVASSGGGHGNGIGGRPPSARPPSAHTMRRSMMTSASGRPGTASRPGTALGSASGRDAMMHARPQSARTGGSAVLLQPEQYMQQVFDFRDTMESYNSQLKAALGAIKAGLAGDVTAAQEALKAPDVDKVRALPSVPRMPSLPRGAGIRAGSGTAAGVAQPQQQPGQGQQQQGVGAAGAGGAAGGTAAAARPGLARDPELDAPEVTEALSMFKRLFPDVPASRPGSSDANGPTTTGGTSAASPAKLGAKPVLGSPAAMRVTATASGSVHQGTAGATAAAANNDDYDRDDARDDAIRGGGDSGDERGSGGSGRGGDSGSSRGGGRGATGPSSSRPASSNRPAAVAIAGQSSGRGGGGGRGASQQLRVTRKPGNSSNSPAGSPSGGGPGSPSLFAGGSGRGGGGGPSTAVGEVAGGSPLSSAAGVVIGEVSFGGGARLVLGGGGGVGGVGGARTSPAARPPSAGRSGPKARLQQQAQR